MYIGVLQVCGNDEAVKFLSDWLCLWRTRGFDTRKNQTCGDQCEMQDDDYCYSNGVSDSEDIDEEASLKKVLLVTGPVGVYTEIFIISYVHLLFALLYIWNVFHVSSF